jgi:hypothetical protein
MVSMTLIYTRINSFLSKTRKEKERKREREMSGDGGEDKEHKHGEENMAAWLVGIKTLKIEPYHLPPLGKVLFPTFLMFHCLGHVFLNLTCVPKYCYAC